MTAPRAQRGASLALPGLLEAGDVRRTVESIAQVQLPFGAIPWFADGHLDAWDHVEAAMALLAGGMVEAAERAYDWLLATQRDDGSWPMRLSPGAVVPDDPATDTNMCAYVAVGVYHHWLVRRDKGFIDRAWPGVRRALDLVTRLQQPFGGIAWAQDPTGRVAHEALVAGSSSIHHALRCGLVLADLLEDPQPEWELALGRLGHALRAHEESFADRSRFSMDWYYPVLGGALRDGAAVERFQARWADFVVPGLGARCVADQPWVTGAETCELVLALDVARRRDEAVSLLRDMQHLRDADGSYWTGYVYLDSTRWPSERSTWTAAAVVLAVDALSGTTGGSEIFRGSSMPHALELDLLCSCGEPADTARLS